MRGTTALLALSLCVVGCGGESENDGSGGSGGATGGSSGAGGSTGGGGGSGGTAGSGGASGGTAGGGGSTGGSGGSTGGTGGSGGSTGGAGGSGGAGPAQPECKIDGDCKMFSDCCSCIGVPTSENPVPCPAMCLQDKCGELGGPKTAACIAGRCVAGFNCDSSKVTCKMATPNCDPGKVPLVKEDGTCWQGSCVPANECKSVKACAECTGSLFCVSYVTQLGPQNHCADVPKACGSDFSCACSGPSVCTPPYGTCQDFSGQKGVSCSCPNC